MMTLPNGHHHLNHHQQPQHQHHRPSAYINGGLGFSGHPAAPLPPGPVRGRRGSLTSSSSPSSSGSSNLSSVGFPPSAAVLRNNNRTAMSGYNGVSNSKGKPKKKKYTECTYPLEILLFLILWGERRTSRNLLLRGPCQSPLLFVSNLP